MNTTAPSKVDVLIVGGGIIGAACAYELSRRGVQATVIDKGEIGFGCSYGNAGWITPCFALPLPMPGMLLKSIQWLLDPDSPLFIKPRPSLNLIRWLARFAFSMNEKLMRQSTAALTELAKHSLDAYRRLDAESPGSFDFTQKGLLVLAQTKEGLNAAINEMELVAPHGIPGRRLDAAATRQLEPAVTGSHILGSVYFPDEAHAEPLAAVKALRDQAVKLGATFLPHTELFDFHCRDRIVESV